MEMYAYIYVPSTKKYLTVKGSEIEDFWYETPGRQSKQFSSKPFKFINTNNKPVVCQVLIVLATVAEIKENIADKRVTVPKLSNSDLRLSQERSKSDIEKSKVGKTRSNLKKDIVKSANKTNSSIIKAHLVKSQVQKNVVETNKTINDAQDNDDINNDISSTESEENSVTERNERNQDFEENEENVAEFQGDGDESDQGLDNFEQRKQMKPPEQQLHREDDENLFHDNNMNARLLEENKNLKLQVSRLRKDQAAANRLTRMLQEKCNNYKSRINKKNEDSNKINIKLKPKGLPTPICSKSGVFVRADALEDAYTKLKPSVFYERMCYLTWGRRTLANRCVKKTKKTPTDCKVLTPRKRRAVRSHFIHYLKYYKYHSVIFNKEMASMNTYAHRAIRCSRRYAELLQEHPELGTDEEEEERDQIEMSQL